MTNLMRVTVVVSLILCGDVCFADDYNSDQLVQILMHKSGLKKQIEQMPQLLQAELDQQQAEAMGLPEEDFNRIRSLARSAFDAKTIHDAVQTYIKLNLSENDMRAVLEWLDSPLGKKITRLEEDASTAEAYTEMQAIGSKLLDENKDSARINKIIRLDDATGTTESTINTVLNVQLAMITAMSAAMEADKRPSFEDVQDLVNMNKSQIQAAMKRMVQRQFLYSYRELTDNEIDRYTQFAESQSGQRYHYVSMRAIDEALVRAARKMGSRMGMRMTKV
jgi:hypothetical protein